MGLPPPQEFQGLPPPPLQKGGLKVGQLFALRGPMLAKSHSDAALLARAGIATGLVVVGAAAWLISLVLWPRALPR